MAEAGHKKCFANHTLWWSTSVQTTMTRASRLLSTWIVSIALLISTLPVCAQQISLQALVTPSTVISKEGHTTTFALHGFIEFSSLSEVFPYIETQTNRWPALSANERQALAADLLRRAVESRVISMTDERPLETLITHTAEELRQALTRVNEPTPPGYADAFLTVQKKWKHSLNCWSAAPSIPARGLSVVSNRGRDPVVRRDLRFDRALLAGGEISP
jgi:hypothetical protein